MPNQPLKPGTNPRDAFGKRHKERGPVRLSFTLEDVAQAAERSLATVRSSLGPLQGMQNLQNTRPQVLLRHIASFVMTRLQTRFSSPPSKDLLLKFLNRHQVKLEDWENRWPKFPVFTCALCDEILFYQGLCASHGGPPLEPVRLRAGHFEMKLASKYVKVHELVLGTSHTGHHRVVHLDNNTLNNHPSNLKV